MADKASQNPQACLRVLELHSCAEIPTYTYGLLHILILNW